MNVVSTAVAFVPTTWDDAAVVALAADVFRERFAMLPPDAAAHLANAQAGIKLASYAAQFPTAQCFRIEAADGVAGSLIVDAQPSGVELVDIAITADHRGRGLGTAGVEHTIALAGGRPVRLTVWWEDAAAVRLYQRLGFRAETDEPGYIPMTHTPGGAT